MGSLSSATSYDRDKQIIQAIETSACKEGTPPMTRALSNLKYHRQHIIDKEEKNSFTLLLDVYLAQIKRNCNTFRNIKIPREVVAICIAYCEALDGTLHLRANTFIKLNANYEYVYESMTIGESSTLSAKQNDKSKAKMTIFCFGDITLHPYSFVHLNESLKLSSYAGYAIYLETFGTIHMMESSHIDIDSRGASIFIKCKQLLMKEGCRIKARNGQKVVLVITDEKNRNEIKSVYMQPGCKYFYPAPEIHAKSPSQALGNIESVKLVNKNQVYVDNEESSTFSAQNEESSSTFSAHEQIQENVVTIGLPQYVNITVQGTPQSSSKSHKVTVGVSQYKKTAKHTPKSSKVTRNNNNNVTVGFPQYKKTAKHAPKSSKAIRNNNDNVTVGFPQYKNTAKHTPKSSKAIRNNNNNVTVGFPQYNITAKQPPKSSKPTRNNNNLVTGSRPQYNIATKDASASSKRMESNKHLVTDGSAQYNITTKETPKSSEIRSQHHENQSVDNVVIVIAKSEDEIEGEGEEKVGESMSYIPDLPKVEESVSGIPDLPDEIMYDSSDTTTTEEEEDEEDEQNQEMEDQAMNAVMQIGLM